MSITIESSTAEAALEALQQLPREEMERLRSLLEVAPPSISSSVDESDEWSDEDIEDFRRSTHQLMERRLGAEEHFDRGERRGLTASFVEVS